MALEVPSGAKIHPSAITGDALGPGSGEGPRCPPTQNVERLRRHGTRHGRLGDPFPHPALGIGVDRDEVVLHPRKHRELHVVVPDIAAYDGFYRRLIAAVPLRNVSSRFAMERMKAAPLPI